jgi:hypothetical protein
VSEDALQFGAKIDFAMVQTVVDGFDAHAVPGKNQAPLGLHPHCNGEHSAEAREARAAPAPEGMQNNLSVAVGAETKALCFQLSANLPMVENFPVENNDYIFIGAEERLVACFEIKDA